MSDKISNLQPAPTLSGIDLNDQIKDSVTEANKNLVPDAGDLPSENTSLTGGPTLDMPVPTAMEKLKNIRPHELMKMLEEAQSKSNYIANRDQVLDKVEARQQDADKLSSQLLIQSAVLDSVDESGKVRFEKLKTIMQESIDIATEGDMLSKTDVHNLNEALELARRLDHVLNLVCSRGLQNNGEVLKQDLLNGSLKEGLKWVGFDEQSADLIVKTFIGEAKAANIIDVILDKQDEQKNAENIANIKRGLPNFPAFKATVRTLNKIKPDLGERLKEAIKEMQKDDKYDKKLNDRILLFRQAEAEMLKYIEKIRQGIKEAAESSKDQNKDGTNTTVPGATATVMTGGAADPA